jgi:Bifunctional DNA primase/polymerase, N-terminal
MTALLEAAMRYARLGWHIHPCRPGEKLPILERWHERATAESTLLERWWGRTPDANVAVATGPGSGIFVLDVDGPEGERALVELERRHGPMPEFYPMQWTGSGRGWQAFFAWPEGRNIRNSAGRLGPKLDTRGEGGFVVLPPSVHPSGGRYGWATDRDPWELPPEFAPDWFLDLLDPPTQPEAPRQAWSGPGRPTDDRYLLRALEAELALVASAPVGRRNDQLNESAFNLFRFAQEGRLDAGAIAHGLEAAARHAGLEDKEVESTLKSAAAKRGVRLP